MSGCTRTGKGCVTILVATGDKSVVLTREAAHSSQSEPLPKRNHHNEDTIQEFSTDGNLNFEQDKRANVTFHGSTDYTRSHRLQPQIRAAPPKPRAVHNLKDEYGGSCYSGCANNYIVIPAVLTLALSLC